MFIIMLWNTTQIPYDEDFTENRSIYQYNSTGPSNYTEGAEEYSISYKVCVSMVLILIAIAGTIGNICIIYAVITQKKLRRLKTNYFVCNLALADLIVTSLVIPATASNVINNNRTTLPEAACMAVGFLMPLSCVASMQNLMLISTQRLAVTSVNETGRSGAYETVKTCFLLTFAWLWSTMLVLPLAINMPPITNSTSTMLKYDYAAGMCAWDDVSAPRYNFALIMVAFSIPLIVSGICYTVLFKKVKGKSRKMSKQMETRNDMIMRRERKLLSTILIVLLVFVASWGPYCLIVLLSTFGIADFLNDETWKRTTAWLGVSNSALNSFIYGWRNENFRMGYKMCFYQVLDAFTCNRYGFRRLVLQRRTSKRQRMSDLARRTVPRLHDVNGSIDQNHSFQWRSSVRSSRSIS